MKLLLLDPIILIYLYIYISLYLKEIIANNNDNVFLNGDILFENKEKNSFFISDDDDNILNSDNKKRILRNGHTCEKCDTKSSKRHQSFSDNNNDGIQRAFLIKHNKNYTHNNDEIPWPDDDKLSSFFDKEYHQHFSNNNNNNWSSKSFFNDNSPFYPKTTKSTSSMNPSRGINKRNHKSELSLYPYESTLATNPSILFNIDDDEEQKLSKSNRIGDSLFSLEPIPLPSSSLSKVKPLETPISYSSHDRISSPFSRRPSPLSSLYPRKTRYPLTSSLTTSRSSSRKHNSHHHHQDYDDNSNDFHDTAFSSSRMKFRNFPMSVGSSYANIPFNTEQGWDDIPLTFGPSVSNSIPLPLQTQEIYHHAWSPLFGLSPINYLPPPSVAMGGFSESQASSSSSSPKIVDKPDVITGVNGQMMVRLHPIQEEYLKRWVEYLSQPQFAELYKTLNKNTDEKISKSETTTSKPWTSNLNLPLSNRLQFPNLRGLFRHNRGNKTNT